MSHPAVLTRFKKKIPETCPSCEAPTDGNVGIVDGYKYYKNVTCKSMDCAHVFVKFIDLEAKKMRRGDKVEFIA